MRVEGDPRGSNEGTKEQNPVERGRSGAAGPGFEPGLSDSESDVVGTLRAAFRYHLWARVQGGLCGSTGDTSTKKAHIYGVNGAQRSLQFGGTTRYESEGRRFESCRARSKKHRFAGLFVLAKMATV